MSCIILQLGQCGNQVGQRVFDTLIEDNLTNSNPKLSIINRSSINDYTRHSFDRFFIQYENKLIARALDSGCSIISRIVQCGYGYGVIITSLTVIDLGIYDCWVITSCNIEIPTKSIVR